eukprot:TRINITY_DN4748_c0_g1_i4.p1 TRINITY_DN4748_c0_g1~~TRINITY_DN4748_c0_g1_i4.p1  ORF type:complete len:320 (+),score=75.22 TRINITY_DN4748_c0_g1_i4:724-1683(+)
MELKSVRDIAQLLDKVKEINRPLFVVAKDVGNDVLATLIYNHQRDIVRASAITVPGFGEFPHDLLSDIALCTSARLFEESDREALQNATIDDLGSATKAILSLTETLIVANAKDPKAMEARIDELTARLNDKKLTQAARTIITDRILRLRGKVAVIWVGGASEVERGEMHDKITDALNAVRGAIESNLLPGGGAALLHATRVLDLVETNNKAEAAGVEAAKKAFKEPLHLLLKNGGYDGPYFAEILLDKYLDNRTGFDVRKGCITDMFDAGVIDSLKVVRTCLEDAVSIAKLILTTEVAIVLEKQYKPSALSKYNFGPF